MPHPSGSRELNRNRSRCDGYKPVYADDLAWARRWRGCRLQRQPALRRLVLDQLAMGWSPEQVAGRLVVEQASKVISHESIYRFIYREIKRTNDGSWRNYLPSRKSKRGRAGARFNPMRAIPDRVSISKRPKSVDTRRQAGHWEADLLHPRKTGAPILVAMERKTRFLMLAKMPSKEAAPIAEKTYRMVRANAPNLASDLDYRQWNRILPPLQNQHDRNAEIILQTSPALAKGAASKTQTAVSADISLSALIQIHSQIKISRTSLTG